MRYRFRFGHRDCSWLAGLPVGGQGFARANTDCKDRAHRHFLSPRHQDAGDGPRLAGLDDDDSFVCFDVKNLLAW